MGNCGALLLWRTGYDKAGRNALCRAGEFLRGGNYLYIHCAQAGEKTDCLNHQPQVCVTCVEGGAWVDQPALTTRYASAVMLGRAEELTDEADKVKALRLLCMRLAPEHPRSHGDFSECRGKTAVWRITVEQITGKANPGNRRA